jgi:hypothetical protein
LVGSAPPTDGAIGHGRGDLLQVAKTRKVSNLLALAVLSYLTRGPCTRTS